MKTVWIKIAILLLCSSCLLQCTAMPVEDANPDPPLTNDNTSTENPTTLVTEPPTQEPTTISTDEPTTLPVTTSSESPTEEPTTNVPPITTDKTTTSTGTPSPSPEPTTPTSTPCPDCPDPGRKFDGLSFFGGILLSFGMMALAYVAYWFYKKRAAKNYHAM